jgi:flagellar biosynthesis/type III secretory pathway M-ring protein FliF/YscJ
MGQNSAQTVREIEESRSRLESDIRELEQRLPAPAVWAKRAVGMAVGGGVGGTVFWFLVRRLRKRRKKEEAAAQAAQAVQAVVQVFPEEWAERLGGLVEEGEWKGWLVIAGGLWLLIRLAELRALRKTNRLLVLSARSGPPTILA